jgi:hypothetical protein
MTTRSTETRVGSARAKISTARPMGFAREDTAPRTIEWLVWLYHTRLVRFVVFDRSLKASLSAAPKPKSFRYCTRPGAVLHGKADGG